jgi:flagellar basal-body rod modification protein FlgD
MSISGITGTTATTSSATSGVATKSAEQTQSDFMKLLIAQMQYQDPTNPMDNSQMASQMSQLNMVTGINTLNTTLSAMAASSQSTDSLKAASLLGHTVLVPGNNLQLSNGNAAMGMELKQPVDDLKVTIKDSSGKVVHTMDMGAQAAGLQNLAWDGATDSGTAAADGAYTFDIQASLAGQDVTASTYSLGKVDNVSITGGIVKLDVASVGNVALSDIREIS